VGVGPALRGPLASLCAASFSPLAIPIIIVTYGFSDLLLFVAKKDYWCALLGTPFKIRGTPTLINRRASNGNA
jgi:hypothetical protein